MLTELMLQPSMMMMMTTVVIYLQGGILLGGVDGYLCVILVSVGDWVPDLCSRGLGVHGSSVFHKHPGNARKRTRLVVEVLLEIHFSSHHSCKYSSVLDGFLLSTVGVSASVNAGIHPSGRHIPKADTPWVDTPQPDTPWADTPGRHPPGTHPHTSVHAGIHPPANTTLGRHIPHIPPG